MGKSPCCSKEGLNRGAWTAIEDKLLTSYIEAHGEGKWTHIPKRAGLNRCGKSCRLRWLNYLRPDIKRGNINHDEEQLIIRLHKLLGNRWSLIAGRLPGRTDNEIKNYWNTTLAKKLRTQSCGMSEQDPSSKLRASEAVTDQVTQPPVIQTKASRCKNVVILEPPYPNHQTSNINNSFPNTQFRNQSPKAKVVDEEHQSEGDENMLSCGNKEFQVDAADWSGDDVFKLESSMGGAMDARADDALPIDELMVNDWATTSGFEVDDNATVDFDSLALLLESGDWL